MVKHTGYGNGGRPHKADQAPRPCHLQIFVAASVGRPGRSPSGRRPTASYEAARSGKNSAISRAADSCESDPCTRFSVVSIPRSPRMVPGCRLGRIRWCPS